jgi:hypothetical protein
MLYSLAEFAPIILPLLRLASARHLVEIGAEAGSMTRALIAHTAACAGGLTTIEAMPTAELEALLAEAPHARLMIGGSLGVLPKLEAADAYLIDGDHNYYTVRNELALIEQTTRAAGRPLLVLLHDVGWPFGRRDGYYDPESIPAGFCHPHDWIKGAMPDRPDLAPGGFRGMGGFAMATTEGSAQNGVLTAIEDFLGAHGSAFRFANVPLIFGLGVLYAADAPWAPAASALLTPYADNALLAAVERERMKFAAELMDLHYRLNDRRVPSG